MVTAGDVSDVMTFFDFHRVPPEHMEEAKDLAMLALKTEQEFSKDGNAELRGQRMGDLLEMRAKLIGPERPSDWMMTNALRP